MPFQMVLDAWIKSGKMYDVQMPATEGGIQAAEAQIGAQLPVSLREVYQVFNGGWAFELDFFPLFPPPEHYALTNSNELYIEYEWRIPKEIRLFASDGGSNVFGIWLPRCGNPIYNHPIIEVGGMPAEDGCMGVAGTNLITFLRRFSAYHLVYDERDELEEGGLKLSRIQKALDLLKVPQSLRGEHFDDEMAPFRKWADPQLPDPYGDSYSQGYTISDLNRIFGAT